MRYEMRHAISFIIVKGFGGVDKNIQMIYCTVLCVLINALSQSGSFKRSKACNRNKIVSHGFLFWRLSIISEAAGGWMGPPLPFVKWSDGYFFISSRARMQSLV